MNQQELVQELSCPICGNKKRTDHPLCGSCFQVYRTEASARLLKGDAVDLLSWVKEKMGSQLEAMRQEVEDLTREIDELSEANRAQATEEIQHTLEGNPKGHLIPRDVVNDAIKQRKDQLWREKAGNRKWGRREELRKKIDDLEKLFSEEPSSPGQSSDSAPADPSTEAAVDRIVEAALAANGGSEQ